LVETIVAVPENNVTVIGVGCSMNIKAFFTIVLNVLGLTTIPSHSISVITLELSHYNSNIDIETLSSLICKS
jgi:hypothetical protein